MTLGHWQPLTWVWADAPVRVHPALGSGLALTGRGAFCMQFLGLPMGTSTHTSHEWGSTTVTERCPHHCCLRRGLCSRAKNKPKTRPPAELVTINFTLSHSQKCVTPSHGDTPEHADGTSGADRSPLHGWTVQFPGAGVRRGRGGETTSVFRAPFSRLKTTQFALVSLSF